MADPSDPLTLRVFYFRRLLECNPTARLRERLCSAISLYEHALDNPSATAAEDLDVAVSEITDHWKKVFEDPFTAAALFSHIDIFHRFLALKLGEDYVAVPYTASPQVNTLAQIVVNRGQKEEQSPNRGFPEHIMFALQESTLNIGNFEDKLRAVSSRGGLPGNDISPLIEAQNWQQLATTLLNDRYTAETLAHVSPIYKKASIVFLKCIDEVQQKYYTSLSPSSFTLASEKRRMNWSSITSLLPWKSGPDTTTLLEQLPLIDRVTKKTQ